MSSEEDRTWYDELYEHWHDYYVEDPLVAELFSRFESRAKAGMESYGETLNDCKMNAKEALENALEEAMDQCVYLMKALKELDG
jgi:hypothetical protein